MTTFEVPTITTARLRLRAFRASDLDAYSAMQANPEVMRYMVMGRTAMPAEVWRTMLASLGSWALRGYGMWACEKIEGDVFIGSAGIFGPLDWPAGDLLFA
jgi:RimJ/RimL family protein N-acetyltransferase